MKERQDIAIVGRACRLPGAPSVRDLWDLLSQGRCAVTQIPRDRWSHDRLLHPRIAERGRTYTFAAGVLDDIWGFDPAAFGMSPREAEQMDPQQRLLLELAWESLEDAGIRPSDLAGSDTGVFVGVSAVDHSNLRILDMASADAYMMTGNTLSVVANRLSYIFDLHGPSFIVDTACSSALVALNEAVVNLRSGRVETALVAGVSILVSPHSFVGFSQAAMLSRRGLCQAFSANADGYVRAEGGAVLVLKTREAAERDGDAIYGVIADIDVNSDGRTNGISLPSKAFQSKLLEKLYVDSGLDLDSLAFFEAHGTGTPVGDPIEAAAIGETVAQRRRDPLLIGSIKSNIGHMEAASGLGGVLKAILALEHDELPPSLHSAELNPHIDFRGLNLEVARESTPLPRLDGRRRLAGVNSFGFGGTNAHVILADGDRRAPPKVEAPPRYLVISAHSRAALASLVADYAGRLETADRSSATTLLAAANHHRDRLPHRVVVPVGDLEDVVGVLDGLADEEGDVVGAVRGTAIERAAPVCFVFSGNGSQFTGMGLAAYARSPAFRERLDAISRDFEALAGWSIVETLNAPDLAARLELTQISQPLLFAIQSALCHALADSGLVPDFVVGHSVGEVAAAEAAGILDQAGALKTIHSRSLHQELTHGAGGMAVVIGSREATDAILEALPSLSIAACNSPRAFTVSGPKAEIARLSEVARRHKARVRKLELDYPFHSALMAPVEAPLMRSLGDLVHARNETVGFVSTVTGTLLDGETLDAAYWWRNVREPVLFSDAISAAAAAGARVFVEIGPAPTLLSHINDTIDERTAVVATLPTLDKRDKGIDPVAFAVAAAIARGARIDDARAFGPSPGAGVDLPLYPWQRKTYRLGETTESSSQTVPVSWHPLVGARFAAERLEWHSSLDTVSHPDLADHNVDGRAILPGAAFAEMALAVARDWLGTEAATIADLEISSPMQLTSEAGREVVCRVSPLINHVEILSRPRLGQTPWQLHATAKILRDASVGTLPDIDDLVPLTPSHSVTGQEIYAMADRAGLHYGPSFRKLETAAAVRPDRITLGLVRDAADPAYGVDPARLDSCFHALVLIFGSLREAVHGTAYIPVRFGEVMLRKPGATFVRGRIDVLRRDERIIIANFLLVDADGEVVLFVREARFQAIRTSRGADPVRKMIYATTTLAAEPTAARADRAPTLATFRQGVAAASPDAMPGDFVLLEGWATSLALATARAFATANVVDIDALVAAGRLPDKLRPWLDELLVSLERSGLVHRDPLGRHIDPEVDVPAPEDILRTIAQEHQNLSAELLIAASTATAIRTIEAGGGEALARSLPVRVLDTYELGSSRVQASAAFLTGLLRRSTRTWPRDRALRLLQIGFGPLTPLVSKLADDMQARLTILDPDRRRLERARITFAERGDISILDKAEDLAASDYDLVLATDALHRCRGVGGFLANLRRSMAPGAVLLAVEPSPSFFRNLVLGLDGRLAEEEGHGASIDEVDWVETLQMIGLKDAQAIPVETVEGTALFLSAELESARRSWSGSGTALIVGADEARNPTAVSALSTLLASSGLHVSLTLEDRLDAGTLAETPAFVVVFAQDPDAKIDPVRTLTAQCMRLKHLADALGSKPTTLWLVTAGAVTAQGDRGADVAAGLWAFSRTLANEVPTLDVRRVDVADELRPDALAERLRDLVLSSTAETEIVLERGATRVLRFENGNSHDRGKGKKAEAARLRRGDGSGFDRLHWDAITRQRPASGEVEIKVEAIGLNFRDVMFGLGLLPEDILEHGFAGPTLGLECAGRIERVGVSVKGLKPGDRVMAFAKNAFSTHVTTSAAVVSPIAPDLPFEAAATIPVAFLTAYHALMLCARLRPGEWVLIHGGAGGVGLAAIQIARWRGARVIATAGSPERRELLHALGAEHVFDSRSGAFVEDVRRVTGEGVGVVVNSLSGEAMERSISVLRPFGRFVELGKRDYVANTHIGLRPFRRNLSYYGVDLDQLLIDEPATSKVLLRSVMRLFARGDLTPLPYRSFDAAETAEAFRLMQQSGHVGKLVVRPPAADEVSAPRRHAFQVSSDKLHVITGGLGGFGIATARWLAGKGARHILLIGRSGAGESAKAAIADLAAEGVRVRAEAVDVADRAALQRLFGRFGHELPQLGGVIHAAMVLDDAMIANVTADQIERVLRPKIAGADNLDAMTRDLQLDYFVLYSSATTLIGNPGQGAYVAANGYLEGLARRRRRAGLPGLAIAWGAIEDVGVLARADATREALANRVGVKGMKAQDALRLMGHVLGDPSREPDDAMVAIAPITWSAARQHLAVLKAPTYAKLSSQDETATGDKAKIDIAALVAKSTPEEARKTISGLIVDEIARVLRLPREDIARTTPLSEIGLDSLMAVELGLGLEERFVLNAPISATASSFTVNELADHIIGLATGTLSEDEALTRTMMERHLGTEALAEISADRSEFDRTADLVRAKSQTLKGVLD